VPVSRIGAPTSAAVLRFAGFPLSAWAFALRIWVAMIVGLYAAFWLQLDSASDAAVTVGILGKMCCYVKGRDRGEKMAAAIFHQA
jgi:uncharacterized membrane protein YccC